MEWLPGIESPALADLALSLPAAFLCVELGLWWGLELKLLSSLAWSFCAFFAHDARSRITLPASLLRFWELT